MATKERLLDEAVQVFAALGYEKATIAEICHRADANIAAVNYHFGSKEKLYTEAWKAAFHEAVRRHPADGGVAADAPAEARFRGRIQAVIRRIMDRECLEPDILLREMAAPTGILHEAIEETVGPFRRSMVATVRELLGSKATEEQCLLSTMSVMAQCMHLLMMRHRARPLLPKHARTLPGPEVVAEHIVSFSLGALGAMRGALEGRLS